MTTTAYEELTGRVAPRRTTPPGGSASVTAYAYDLDGKVLTVTVDDVTEATVTYDTYQQLASITYADGSALSSVVRDGAGRVIGNVWDIAGRTVSVHAAEQMVLRRVSASSLLGAVARPVAIGRGSIHPLLGASAKIVGRRATVTVGSRSRAITTVYPTSRARLMRSLE